MGFWGKLGKAFSIAGPIAANFIVPGSGAALSTGMKVLKGGLALGGLAAGAGIVGSKVAKELSGEDPNAKLLREQGTRMFGASTPAFEQALGTYGKLASGDKATLASFTGTEANELNRAASNQIARAKATMNRGGAQSKVLAEAPGELERGALALRSDARGKALDKLGSLGLAGSEVGSRSIGIAGDLGLARRRQNIGIAEGLGEGVGTILDKTGVWGKLGQTMGNILGGNKADGGFTSGTKLPSGVSIPGVPEFPSGDYAGSDLSLPNPNLNLDIFGQKKNEQEGGLWGQAFNQ